MTAPVVVGLARREDDAVALALLAGARAHTLTVDGALCPLAGEKAADPASA